MKKELEVLDMIIDDCKKDVEDFEGKPFNGKTVAEIHGILEAKIQALAEEMEDNLNEIGNKPWRAMRWIAEFLESREGDYNKECAKEYRKLEAFYSNGGFEVIDTLLADETFNLNHPHLIAELREKVGNK